MCDDCLLLEILWGFRIFTSHSQRDCQGSGTFETFSSEMSK
jgi:hypothetical protein